MVVYGGFGVSVNFLKNSIEIDSFDILKSHIYKYRFWFLIGTIDNTQISDGQIMNHQLIPWTGYEVTFQIMEN